MAKKFRILPPSGTQVAGAIAGRVNLYPKQTEEFSDNSVATSYLGTPIYDRLVLLTNNTGLGSGIIDPDTGLDKYTLILDEALITVSQTKNIVKTPINGRNGTVKEYISLGDYSISVQAFITSRNPNEFPVEQLDLFELYANLDRQINIESRFLEVFRVRSFVIESYRIGQQQGFRNRIPISLNCISDQDIELQLKETQNVNT